MSPNQPDISELMKGTSVAAVILGGGRGTRLFPLTAERAKPAVPLGGRYRLIDIPLSNCIHSGVNRIFVMTQFLSASLNKHIGTAYKFDHFSGGYVEILAAMQTSTGSDDWYQGTADAVRKHLQGILEAGASHYLILSGDQLYRMDYRSMLSTHLRSDADITVGALPVDKDSAKSFGVMQVNSAGRIKHFVEKPQESKVLRELVSPSKVFERHGFDQEPGKDYLASMGVYLFKAEALDSILSGHKEWNDFGSQVIPKSLKSRRVYCHPFQGFWEDIGTVRSYYEVSISLTSSNPPFEFYDPKHTIFTNVRYLPGTRVNGAAVKDSIICEGSHITGATISNSIIGIRSNVQRGADIDKSIILGADYYEDSVEESAVPIGIGRNSKISTAIIDKNARIGKNVVIRGSKRHSDKDGDGWAIRDGIVVVMKNAVIPDGTQIG